MRSALIEREVFGKTEELPVPGCLLLVLLLSSGGPSIGRHEPSDSLRMTVSLESISPTLRELLVVTLEVANQDDEAILVWNEFHWATVGTVTYEVLDEHGQEVTPFVVIDDFGARSHDVNRWAVLRPNESLGSTFVFPVRDLVPGRGRYTLQVVYRVPPWAADHEPPDPLLAKATRDLRGSADFEVVGPHFGRGDSRSGRSVVFVR
jgi:hypothetical protein